MLISRCVARLAETFPSSFRSQFSTLGATSRPYRTAAIQKLSFDYSSRRNVGLSERIGSRPHSSSHEPLNAKDEKARNLQRDMLQLDEDLVYQAPMSRAVRLMKAVSITSCSLTSIGMPVLCVLSEQDTSTVGKWAMCGTIMLFGLGTTSLFHFLFKPYVMRMWLIKGVDEIVGCTVIVETLTIFAQLERHSFRLSDVSPPTQAMHPMVSFQAKGRHYFIHPESFDDQNLLNKLVRSRANK
ncbi:Uncharacterized membrane protein [Plasmopara halstedii]|uniref:Uncharacterized membrane protein n=1 Tax=Plasmopara halstedii TaxID=4781 RepID=A0A0P1B2N0_PLAHL|nr:Uncharacterized membrane protein [Plasmopara halstedii]CEG48049.1 Uncharacterized membrane protein [Plasmopara halstedii]|eukprot:XP_024584418.1 Uncharacterized membrane protein [Plasmopara halstedii]